MKQGLLAVISLSSSFWAHLIIWMIPRYVQDGIFEKESICPEWSPATQLPPSTHRLRRHPVELEEIMTDQPWRQVGYSSFLEKAILAGRQPV
jgi:hypothetical protein